MFFDFRKDYTKELLAELNKSSYKLLHRGFYQNVSSVDLTSITVPAGTRIIYIAGYVAKYNDTYTGWLELAYYPANTSATWYKLVNTKRNTAGSLSDNSDVGSRTYIQLAVLPPAQGGGSSNKFSIFEMKLIYKSNTRGVTSLGFSADVSMNLSTPSYFLMQNNTYSFTLVSTTLNFTNVGVISQPSGIVFNDIFIEVYVI